MPLYKKSTTKSKVKTQNSFISPLLNTQNKIDDLIKDDYKDNLPIPVKKKVLEPLINIAKDGNLFDKLQYKSFKDSPKTSSIYSKKKSNSVKSTKSNAQMKTLSKTLSNLSSQNPEIFDSPDLPVQKRDERVESEKSTVITTKIEINSTTVEEIINIKKTCETPDSQLSDMLNECVNNNLRLSQQLWGAMESTENNNKKITIRSDDISDNLVAEDEEKDLDSSLMSMLDDLVKTNTILSQEMMKKDEFLISSENKTKEKKITEYNKDLQLESKNLKRKCNLKKAVTEKPNIKISRKSTENIKNITKLKTIKDDKLKKDLKLPMCKRLKAICSEENLLTSPKSGNKNLTKGVPKKNKVNNTDKKLNQKIEQKYLTKTEKSTKSKNIRGRNNIPGTKEKNQEKKKNVEYIRTPSKKNDDKKERSFTGTKYPSDYVSLYDIKSNKDHLNKVKFDGPSDSKNMISTLKNKIPLDELLKLQEERDVGLYVYCDTCDKVRYLKHCKDPLDLPAKWYCYMNPDHNYNKCSDPNYDIEPEKEELMIYNKFNAGSIVWAKMDGYPWWPAIVDDDPDLTDYFWLDDENSLEPSWYHVTFFDSGEVTRAWIRTTFLEPFEVNVKNPSFKQKKYDYYRNRLNFAIREAKIACKMGILERLRHYSFVTRYFKQQNNRENGKKKKTGGRTRKSDVRKYINQKDNITKLPEIDRDKKLDENTDTYDKLSVSSSEISTILKSKKPRKNRKIDSDEDILENIDFNNFIWNEDAFEELKV